MRLMDGHYPNVTMSESVYNAMLSVYLKHYKLKAAMDLLTQMSELTKPDKLTYLLMMNGFRLNCKELVQSNGTSDEYIQRNLAENCIEKADMIKLTKQTFKDCISQLGVPTIKIFGCIANTVLDDIPRLKIMHMSEIGNYKILHENLRKNKQK